MSALSKPYLTAKEYLDAERRSDIRHEYYRGETFAMSGASREHNLVALNIGAELRAALKGRPCEVYTNDMRVLIEATGLHTYPDVVVVCGEPRFLEGVEVDTLLNPTVLIEVLSPSTSSYERGRKFAHYRQLNSLCEYVLIEQDEASIDRYTRRPGEWSLTDFRSLDLVLELGSIGCEIPLSEIYARVEFPEVPPAPEPDDPRARPGDPR